MVVAVLVFSALAAHGQAAARFMGSITSISGNTLTVKTDAGEQKQVEVPAEATLKRIEPGQKDLNSAATMAFSDLAVGDRVLVKLDPNAATPQAALVVAIKQADVAKKQQQDQADWQKRGIAGLVKSVDTGAGVIEVTTGAGPTVKTVTVKTTKATTLKRYAPGSVRFADAQPAPIDAIHSGDQLRARGNKNTDGSVIDAEDVVSGTFRNVAGMINAIDPAASTIVIKDLATKKPVTIHITSDAQLRRIPDRMAQMLAARLKGTMPAGGWQQRAGGAAPQAGAAPPAGGAGGGQWAGQGGAGGAGGGDPQRFLAMAPAIKIADLQKGEAVMVVATDGSTDVNAITLLAGVEPLLEAPAATNLLSNWSMGGGGGDAAGASAQ
jgi:TusA-related sulfurtransferase